MANLDGENVYADSDDEHKLVASGSANEVFKLTPYIKWNNNLSKSMYLQWFI